MRKFLPKGSVGQEILKELGTTCSTRAERRPVLGAEAQNFAKKRFPSKQVQSQAYDADSTAPAAEELDEEDRVIGEFFAKHVLGRSGQ